jgi:4-amino-4-deoxy-L-arabinose transferase-like glycosyltransferase
MTPYFLTYGIFGFFLYGMFRTQFKTTRIRISLWIALYLALTILVLQSAFQAFQSRYLLPLVPLTCIVAGHGMAVWQKRCVDHRGRFLALVVPALGWGMLFSALVAFYQGTPFVDIKEASEFVRTLPQERTFSNARGEVFTERREVFTTEFYNASIPSPKVEFWTGRERVHLLGSEVQPRPGDYIIMPSLYGGLGGGGWQQYQQVKKEIAMLLPARELERFAYISYPLLPDIMEEPVTHVNPLAWHLRYFRQNFETTVFEVVVPGSAPAPEEALPETP